MCLILFAVRAHPRYPLVVAANRDEWFFRETASAAFWPDAPHVLAGRDLVQNGTWMGITRAGRFAAVTNFREPGERRTDAKSRGALVKDYLTGAQTPATFVASAAAESDDYNGFNLLTADRDEVRYLTNRAPDPALAHRSIDPGVHGLSNHLLNTDWPKVRAGKLGLQSILRNDEVDPGDVFDLLADRRPADPDELPRTGVALERERALSAAHVMLGEYGTRSATVLLVDRDGWIHFSERAFAQDGTLLGATTEIFRLSA